MAEKKRGGIELIALNKVPESERQHWASVGLVQAGYMISATSLWTGSLLISGMSLMNALIAGAIGYGIIVIICTLQGVMGRDLGVPSIVAAGSTFGERGSQLFVSLIMAVSTIGWFAINANICGAAFSGLLESSFNISIPIPVSIVFWGIIMTSTAVLGFNSLKKLNIVAVPVMIAAVVVAMYMVLTSGEKVDFWSYMPADDMTISMWVGVDIVLGGFILGAIAAADFTRYQRTRVDVLKSSFIGIFPLGVVLLLAGALLSIVVGSEDLTVIFVTIGLPVLGLMSLILSTWPANSANAYASALDIMNVVKLDDKYRPWVAAGCGIFGTIIGSFEVIFYFETFLIYLSIVLTPIAGIMIADYWVIGKGKAENWKVKKGFNWMGIVSLVIGVVSSLFITVGLASFNGAVISFVVYLIIKKLFGGNSN